MASQNRKTSNDQVKSEDRLWDKFLWTAVLGAPVVWLVLVIAGVPVLPVQRLAEHIQSLLLIVIVYPVLEEIVFRGGLQEWLSVRFRNPSWQGVSLANVVTSLLFTATHFIYHPPLWAASVFLPSLVFGFFKDRHRSLKTPIALHIFYNFGYALLFIKF